MSEKIKINKHSGSITFTNNGISFSQSGIAKEILDLITNLQQKVEQLESMRKEAIELINNHQLVFRLSSKKQIENWFDEFYKDLSDILNKGDNNGK